MLVKDLLKIIFYRFVQHPCICVSDVCAWLPSTSFITVHQGGVDSCSLIWDMQLWVNCILLQKETIFLPALVLASCVNEGDEMGLSFV